MEKIYIVRNNGDDESYDKWVPKDRVNEEVNQYLNDGAYPGDIKLFKAIPLEFDIDVKIKEE